MYNVCLSLSRLLPVLLTENLMEPAILYKLGRFLVAY